MNRYAAVLLVVLGAWLAGTVFMWQVAIQNFAVAEAVAASGNAGLREATGSLAEADLRLALRYQASETNRLFFEGWGWLQIPLGAAALMLAWLAGAGRWATVPSGAMLAISIALAVYVVPETVRLGRLIDFAAQTALPDVRAQFWTFHHMYTGVDMAKFLMGLVVAGVLVRGVSSRAQ